MFIMGRKRILGRICLGVLLAVQVAGCGILPAAPSWQRAGEAARHAAMAPQTWAPLAGAAFFQVGDFDERLADWASEHTPLFGSREGAADASDWLLASTAAAYGGTLLAAHSGEEKSWSTRLDRLAVGGAAVLASGGATVLLKEAVGRERPDDSDDGSFPSLHTAGAAAFSTLAARNLDRLALTGGERTLARTGLGALTVATGWARIEAEQHYPSDVLVGAALGHFFGAFFTEAYFPGGAVSLQPEFALREDRFGLQLRVVY